ncbi:heptaprenyl diphosphate synthase component 1 [Paenibacillus lentus]|uniref:Heptaprenyl diphosphate synthase n=1 Tax=Paenibacillus lentus TaxID=1338368 RepID=A0A3S8RVS6_9BACL|nr:heptaprenyl diphosphate synthase component 1 [Paenibacillus lentus]AZK47171.1 heptaprenyl diphosphate synthase [Paenibacillus lentus]
MKPYRITEMAHKYVEYDMITNHTALPDYPVARVRLLYMFLNIRDNGKIRAHETSALAAFLVQLGLDTHDTIDVDSTCKEERSMRSRQLKVLAGDYFSSLFYQLLAKAGQIEMVSSMSSAICEVNRLKVGLYNRLKKLLPTEDYLKECTYIKMGLFQSFSHLLDKPLQNLWRLLLAELSRCEVVLGEMKASSLLPDERQGYAYLRIMETGTAEDKEVLSRRKVDKREWSSLLAKYDVNEQLAHKLHQSVERVQALVQELKGDKEQSELTAIIEPFRAALAMQRRAIQEG